jgi:hypothetical protein
MKYARLYLRFFAERLSLTQSRSCPVDLERELYRSHSCPKGISRLKYFALTVNGNPVIIGNCDIFDAITIFLAIIPIFMVAGTNLH